MNTQRIIYLIATIAVAVLATLVIAAQFTFTGGFIVGDGVPAELNFLGKQDELGFYNRELTETEVGYIHTRLNSVGHLILE